MQVCADVTAFLGKKKGKDLACFSFALSGVGVFLPGKWLGWWQPMKLEIGLSLKGQIYECPDGGGVVRQKRTTCIQDMRWLKWIMDKRLGITDLYSHVHNCVSYSMNEYIDAPGNH